MAFEKFAIDGILAVLENVGHQPPPFPCIEGQFWFIMLSNKRLVMLVGFVFVCFKV